MLPKKQISIVLEQHLHTQAMPGGECKELPTKYEVVKIVNALVIPWESTRHKMRLTVGSMLTEQQADELARCKVYQVTITK